MGSKSFKTYIYVGTYHSLILSFKQTTQLIVTSATSHRVQHRKTLPHMCHMKLIERLIKNKLDIITKLLIDPHQITL